MKPGNLPSLNILVNNGNSSERFVPRLEEKFSIIIGE